MRLQIRNLKDEEEDYAAKLKLARRGLIAGDEALMSQADKDEMELNLKRLRRQIRVFQRAIRMCRDRWQELKTQGKVPESSGARKLRETILAKRAANAFGGLARKSQGGGGVGGGLAGQVGAADREKEVKVKVLSFGFGFGGFDPPKNQPQTTREDPEKKRKRLKDMFSKSLKNSRASTIQWGGLGLSGRKKDGGTADSAVGGAAVRFKSLEGDNFMKFSMSS